MPARRFPWGLLALLWLAGSIALTWFFWTMAMTQNFDDPDDFLRMLQVRDFVAGQSWFDLTQYRMAPPAGLPMHWSRLVDIPILAVLLPLKPLVGQHLAEIAATVVAPSLTLLTLMAAMVAISRRLFGPDTATTILAALLPMSAPAVFLQIHPARIDHHGWQIALAAVAIAALLGRDARRSGIGAGVALALYLNISIEGAPFAVAAIGAVGLLWAIGRDDAQRLTSTLGALVATTLVATLLTAPAYRWTEGLCDAVMPSHIFAMGVAAAGTALVARTGAQRGRVARFAGLGLVLVLTIAAFGITAPNCLGSPFGSMDPVVRTFWYENVPEGMPFWRQDRVAAASMIAFPIVGLIGTGIGWWRATSPETQRRWTIMLVILVFTFVTGALVRRAAAVTHVVAVPGAMVLIGIVVAHAEARLPSLAKALAMAGAVLGFSPLMPIVAAASVTPVPKQARQARPIADPSCERLCALRKLAQRRSETILTGIDLGPIVLANTPHSIYGTGYHRLQTPLRETIQFFEGSPDAGAAFMRVKRFRHILIAPGSAENTLFIEKAPRGMMARLVKGPLPDWLVEEPLGSPALRLFRVRD